MSCEASLQQLADLLNLDICEDRLPGVADNFEILSHAAELVMEFPIPDDEDEAA